MTKPAFVLHRESCIQCTDVLNKMTGSMAYSQVCPEMKRLLGISAKEVINKLYSSTVSKEEIEADLAFHGFTK